MRIVLASLVFLAVMTPTRVHADDRSIVRPQHDQCRYIKGFQSKEDEGVTYIKLHHSHGHHHMPGLCKRLTFSFGPGYSVAQQKQNGRG